MGRHDHKTIIVDNKITCKKCNENKSIDHFGINRKYNSYRNTCIFCCFPSRKLAAEKKNLLEELEKSGKRPCIKCKENKDKADFGLSKGYIGGRNSICKICANIKAKQYQKASALKFNYNLSMDDYQKMLLDQNYKCLICNNDLKNLNYRFVHVDHCHKTLKTRGILCSYCNLGLGHFKDDIDNLKSAISYLEKYNND